MAERPLGVVPVLTAAAVAELAGLPLVTRAVAVLRRSGVLGRIVVVAAIPVGELDGELDGADLLAAAPGLPAALRAVLADDPGEAPLVVLDPLQVLTPPQLVPAVLDVLLGVAGPDQVLTPVGAGPYAERTSGAVAADAVIPVRPVTDTLKQVDAAGAVTATVDRDGFRWALSPQAFRREALRAALQGAAGGADGPDLLARLVARAGGRVVTLAAAVDVLRADDPDGLELAAAVTAAGAAYRAH